ncbi:MAG: ArdC family protein [Candidatus Methylacidiphilales bacterium]
MKDIQREITERFIEQLKKGTVPWRRPWVSAQNIVSQKAYRGINSLLLGSASYNSPFWMTFKQARDLGGNVCKGAKAMPVVYYKFLDKRDKAGNVVLTRNGTPAKVPLIRWSMVFNLEQTEKIEAPKVGIEPRPAVPLAAAAAILENAKLCPIKHGGFAALYSPDKDIIKMPPEKMFRSAEDYFHTAYHEATHATGHSSRLDREGVTMPSKFGSERYSKEELVAELGAAFLSNEAGILDKVRFDNSASYLDSWINKLEKDHSLILSAASQAQKSTDFILGVKLNEQETLAEGQDSSSESIGRSELPQPLAVTEQRQLKEATPGAKLSL